MHRVQNEVKFSPGHGNSVQNRHECHGSDATSRGTQMACIACFEHGSPTPAAWLVIGLIGRLCSIQNTCASCMQRWLPAETAPRSEKVKRHSAIGTHQTGTIQANDASGASPGPTDPNPTRKATARAGDGGVRSAGTLLGSIRPPAQNDEVDGDLAARVVEALVSKRPGEHVRSKALSAGIFCGSRGVRYVPRAVKAKSVAFPRPGPKRWCHQSIAFER